MGMENRNKTVLLDNLVVGYGFRHKNMTRVFGPVTTVVYEGEMIGILGRNGIGKSTLMRTLATLQPPLSGRVLLKGVPSGNIGRGELAKMVAFVSTDTVHSFEIRVIELVSMGRHPHTGWFGMLKNHDKQAIDKAVEQTGISSLLGKSIHELSDGERQKVMIARALAQDTPVIILDEPTAFLDLPARYEIMRLLSNLSLRSNKTVIFSTHDLNTAIDVSDKLWLMADDTIYEGAPEDLLIRDVFRKLFINSPAEFDFKSASFKIKRHYKWEIEVSGSRKFRQLTKRALERIGFQSVDEAAEWKVDMDETGDAPTWRVSRKGEERFFFSIYEMIAYLRNSVEH